MDPLLNHLQLYQHPDKQEATRLLQQVLPALSSLHGSAFSKALAATATTVKAHQFQPTATLGAVSGAAIAMVADAAEVIRGCALASYALDWVATEPVVTAASAASAGMPQTFALSGSSSGGSVQDASGNEQLQAASRAILLSGLSAVASRFAGEHPLFKLIGAVIGNMTGILPVSLQVQICMGGLGALLHLMLTVLVALTLLYWNVSSGMGVVWTTLVLLLLLRLRHPAAMHRMLTALQDRDSLAGVGDAAAAAAAGVWGQGSNLLQTLGGLVGTGGNPFRASPEVQAAQGLPKGPDSSGACWACGRTAEAAAAAGCQLQRGGDGKLRLKRCSRCQAAHYCSAECQQAHWQAHKPTCVPVGASK